MKATGTGVTRFVGRRLGVATFEFPQLFRLVARSLFDTVYHERFSNQGTYLPDSRVPIVAEERICESRPVYVVILPWNLAAELATQLEYIREWGSRFVTAVPSLEVA
jgi:hypothetical protein